MMNENNSIITKFYTAFANHDAENMASCYHKEVVFEDPVFGKLNYEEVISMWKMLLARSKGHLKIVFSDVKSDAHSGTAKWIATYKFSKTNRQVVNVIQASFQFKDGLIIKHTDTFDLWKWSQQALGFKGLLLGWTKFLQQKIQHQAQSNLQQYTKTIFREATIDDIPQMAEVRLAVKENVLFNPDLVPYEHYVEYITQRGKGWVCEIDKKVVGFSVVDMKDHNIWALFINPKFEKKGIGRKLHNMMLDWYFQQTKTTVWLGTEPKSRAETFYSKSGWKAAGMHGQEEVKFEMTFEDWQVHSSNA
jgi:GNAT superfamily N-acetyltransferase/ketosteroid isomerase-like protein